MATVPDQDPVQALGPHAAHPPFGICVCTRSSDRGLHDSNAVGHERGVEAGHELGTPVADQHLDLNGALTEGHCQVARLLGHPLAGWMRVTPPSQTRRRSTMKNSTYIR